VGIVGAGPAGLVLAHLLRRDGIDCMVLEKHSRQYCEERIRAGVLEYGTAQLLHEIGVGDRMQRQGLVHDGVELRVPGRSHRIDFKELTGKSITVYGQHEVVRDLIHSWLTAGGALHFEAQDLTVEALDTRKPRIRYRNDVGEQLLECDFIAGCDGFHGICRPSLPAGALTVYERVYPFAWLGILAEAAPSSEELIYAYHDRGFALHSMRSPTITRLYLQCTPEEDLDQWPDDRIWTELQTRLADGQAWHLNQGLILQKGVTGMRSFVVEPMQFESMFLAGDAAHIVPPTGAKGLNLAVADVLVLAHALREHYRDGTSRGLEQYSETCLRRVWKVQRFSWWMTSMLHKHEGNPFDQRRQLAELDYVFSSRAASQTLAENYVGLPFEAESASGNGLSPAVL
jgi:p-hydroxybenzoate 3-monooxygenase